MERVKLEKKARGKPFKKGHKKMGGRKLGTPTLLTQSLKAAMIEAASMIGFDGEGYDGARGYLARVALLYPEKYMDGLMKLLPTIIDGKVDATVNGTIKYETLEELAQAMKKRGLPPPTKLIELNPRPVRERVPHDDTTYDDDEEDAA